MKKDGLSQVVAVTLVVMLSVFAVTILFMFIIPSIDDNLEEITQERIRLSIETEGGFTIWDSSTGQAMIQVKRGNDDLELEAINFGFFQGSKTETLNHSQARPDTNGLPSPGQKHVYIFDLTQHGLENKKPEKIVISAIVAGKEQSISDETGELSPDNTELNEQITLAAKTLLESYDYELNQGQGIGESCNFLEDGATGKNIVDDCEKLQCMNTNLTGDYLQTVDIDCSNTSLAGVDLWDEKGFNPIGSCEDDTCNSGEPFTGTFDGNGHNIDGLHIYRVENLTVGLFGYVDLATLDDINLTNINITGKKFAGGIAGYTTQSSINNPWVRILTEVTTIETTTIEPFPGIIPPSEVDCESGILGAVDSGTVITNPNSDDGTNGCSIEHIV